jgi:very-short-patch-repair endonuclease
MIVSKLDNTVCKNKLGLSTHLKKFNMTLLEYYVKYEFFQIPVCKFCDNLAKHRRSLNFKQTCGSAECHSKLLKARETSNETKEKIRRARFNYLSNNENRKNTAWYKKSNDIFTYGEKMINLIFIENQIYEKYDVVREYPIYPYFIDFAFINEKIAFEYDGKCHFINGKRIEHDKNRDEYLLKRGWRTYRVTYEDIKSFDISNFLDFIGNPTIKIHSPTLQKYKKEKNSIRTRETTRLKYEESQKIYINTILLSKIDFSKIGWVNDVSKILNISPQKVNLWMKRFMNDFYEKSCFKRKTTIRKFN